MCNWCAQHHTLGTTNELGLTDIMICGGTEHATVALGSSGFTAMLLTTNNDNPVQVDHGIKTEMALS